MKAEARQRELHRINAPPSASKGTDGWAARTTGIMRGIEETLTVGLFIAMFATVVLGIVFRVLLHQPLVWTVSVSTLAFIGVVMIGSGPLNRDDSHIVFDLVYQRMPLRVRALSNVLSDLLIIVPFTAAIPATIRYLQFMHDEKVPGVGVPFSLVFGTFLIFLIATVMHRLGHMYRGLRQLLTAREAIP